MKVNKIFFAATLLGLAAAAWSQNRPGLDRPIRVAMFKGTGTGGSTYWHTNIHTSHTVMQTILSNPRAANLGDTLVVPDSGFVFRTMRTSGTTECAANGCGPDATALADFAAYIRDSADVMILSCAVNFGSRVNNVDQRAIIANHWTTKGYVGIHAITDSKSTWSPLDTIHGTLFNNHPAEQAGRLRIDSVFAADSNWQYLNKGVFSNGVDSTFTEEWFFFTNSGAQIRARPFLKPTTKLIESSLPNPNTGLNMGDHPHSWFRQLPTGGRTFYTGLGHRANVWQGTRAFRRQIYNAILWTAKYDSLKAPSTSIAPSHKAFANANQYSRFAITPGALTVTAIPAGAHTVELTGLDGRRVALQTGAGADKAYNFTGLRSGVYTVSVTTTAGRSNRLVSIQ